MDDLHCDGLFEFSALLDLEHEIASVDVLHDKVESIHRLEAGMQLNEEWRPVAHSQHVFFHHSALDVIVLDDDVFFQDLDGVQLVRSFPFRQHHLHYHTNSVRQIIQTDVSTQLAFHQPILFCFLVSLFFIFVLHLCS